MTTNAVNSTWSVARLTYGNSKLTGNKPLQFLLYDKYGVSCAKKLYHPQLAFKLVTPVSIKIFKHSWWWLLSALKCTSPHFTSTSIALQWGIKTCNWQVVSSSQLVCYHITWVNSGLHTSGIPHSFRWSAAVGGYVPILWVTDYKRWSVYNRIPYQVKQAACDRGITAENIEMSQNTDFNRDATNENTSVADSNVWV